MPWGFWPPSGTTHITSWLFLWPCFSISWVGVRKLSTLCFLGAVCSHPFLKDGFWVIPLRTPPCKSIRERSPGKDLGIGEPLRTELYTRRALKPGISCNWKWEVGYTPSKRCWDSDPGGKSGTSWFSASGSPMRAFRDPREHKISQIQNSS